MHDYDEYLTTEEMEVARPKRAVDDEMDLTPMVDVTFLLLIFFMITAAFAVQKAISVPPVDDSQASASQSVDQLEEDSIVIRVDADNVYWISAPRWNEEQQAFSQAEMRTKVRDAREDGKGPLKLLVQANGSSRHESVVAALDAGSGVGVEEIQLLSYEDGDFGF
ncbi:MAG: biopolymer transporter ExbD [Pirellulales bacterium]|nr:biopolymer transporter ExbD [Pirellulales bacterium]